MRPARLFWRILFNYAAPNILVAILFLTIVSVWQSRLILRQTGDQLESTARMMREYYVHALADQPAGEVQRRLRDAGQATRLRITIVDGRGAVLGDSAEDFRRMANHADRPEVQQARSEGVGRGIRESSTIGRPMYYVALVVSPDDAASPLVRVAMDISAVRGEVAATWRLLWGLALATGLLAIVLTYVMVRRLIRPLAQLTSAARALATGDDASVEIDIHRSDELGQLATAFAQMRRELFDRMGALRDSQEQLTAVLSSMSEGVLAVDAQRRMMFLNAAAHELLNVATSAVGRPLMEVTRCREVHEAVQHVMREGSFLEREFDAPGTTRRALLLRAARLPGTPCPGAVLVLHDVSELRRLENLRQELVANVSHELKTPLASIKAYAETLRLGAIHDPEHRLQFVMNIEEQADRLHLLIQDLLQLARVESGQEAFEMTDVDVAAIVEGCVAQRHAEADAKSIQIQVEPPPEPVWAWADDEGLYTILDNLVGNAIKYTPDAGRVTVGWRAEAERVILWVEDTGIGIAPAHRARVFERFYRVDRARSRELGGTGLGLSIVKHLVQAFGGTVGLSSQLGEGSRFEVSLRLARPAGNQGRRE